MAFSYSARSTFGQRKDDESALQGQFWPKVRSVAASIPFAEDLLAAYYCAFDRETPASVKAALFGALAYFVLPFDAMPDILPAETPLWQHIEHVFATLMASYGYAELRLPLVEPTELFARSIGEVTDIVKKEMYVFDDRNGDSLALRPEATAGIVRSAIEHNWLYNGPMRVWTVGPMFRYERPQKGRQRQFHQFDVEALGFDGPDVDAEQIVMLAVLRLGADAYGMTVRREIEERTGREISIGAVYATLERLEAKGYVSSFTGEPTAERGGRAKRHFEIEAAGHRALNASQNALKNMSAGLSRRWKRA